MTKIQTTTYNKFDMYDRKEKAEQDFRQRERTFNAIRKQERELVLAELEKRTNEKIKYIPKDDKDYIMALIPMVSVEDLTAILQELKENPPKHKKFGLD